jgi:hypothetical protein
VEEVVSRDSPLPTPPCIFCWGCSPPRIRFRSLIKLRVYFQQKRTSTLT